MRLALALIGVLALAGCARTTEIVEVDAPGAISGTLVLNGHKTELHQSGSTFSALRKIFRDNSGEIVIRYRDKPPVVCPVEYLTPGVQEHLRFRIQNGRCEGPLEGLD
jgi:hypothetical protein